jgi:hypothetical protein
MLGRLARDWKSSDSLPWEGNSGCPQAEWRLTGFIPAILRGLFSSIMDESSAIAPSENRSFHFITIIRATFAAGASGLTVACDKKGKWERALDTPLTHGRFHSFLHAEVIERSPPTFAS